MKLVRENDVFEMNFSPDVSSKTIVTQRLFPVIPAQAGISYNEIA